MKVGMLLKYKTIDKEEIKVELDVFKKKPKQWVQAYNGKIVHKKARLKMLNKGEGFILDSVLKSENFV